MTSTQEQLEILERMKLTNFIFFTVGNTDYLKHGGRIGKLAGIASSALSLKPLITLERGVIEASGIGRSRKKTVAKTMAINAIVATVKKQPVKIIAKEVSKIVPIVGQLVAPSISVAMLESAGWLLAEDLSAQKKRGPEELPPTGGHNFRYEKKIEEPES